jgi:hypothetical protein
MPIALTLIVAGALAAVAAMCYAAALVDNRHDPSDDAKAVR